jgi:predicted esterase
VDFPLWIGIPHIIGDMAIPPGLGFYIDNVKSEMKSKGMKATKIFYGGHSLGGASISRWMSSNPDEVEGGFLWGSYVSSSIKDPAKNYPVPLLTVGA